MKYFVCDPVLNTPCKKNNCWHIHAGECRATTNIDYARTPVEEVLFGGEDGKAAERFPCGTKIARRREMNEKQLIENLKIRIDIAIDTISNEGIRERRVAADIEVGTVIGYVSVLGMLSALEAGVKTAEPRAERPTHWAGTYSHNGGAKIGTVIDRIFETDGSGVTIRIDCLEPGVKEKIMSEMLNIDTREEKPWQQSLKPPTC